MASIAIGVKYFFFALCGPIAIGENGLTYFVAKLTSGFRDQPAAFPRPRFFSAGKLKIRFGRYVLALFQLIFLAYFYLLGANLFSTS